MKVLITGVAGFVGAYLAGYLADRGVEVVGVDNLEHANYPVEFKNRRLKEIFEHGSFEFSQGDILELRGLYSIPGGSPVDAVIHLAAKAGVTQSLDDPRAYYQTNVLGTLEVVEYCKSRGIKKLIMASTSSVYAVDDEARYNPRPDEESESNFCSSPYAASKKAAEQLVYTLTRGTEIDATIFRLFTVYGPAGRPDNRASVFRFIRDIANGRTVKIHGEGKVERDLVYVDDVARAFYLALQQRQGVGYEIINIGSGTAQDLTEAVSTIGHLLGKNPVIEYVTDKVGGYMPRHADSDKARRVLGWEPNISFSNGARECVNWYMANREWVDAL